METSEWIFKGALTLLAAFVMFVLGSHERRIRNNGKDVNLLAQKHEACSAQVQARLTAGDEDFQRFEKQNEAMEKNISNFNKALARQEVLVAAADRQIQKLDDRMFNSDRRKKIRPTNGDYTR